VFQEQLRVPGRPVDVPLNDLDVQVRQPGQVPAWIEGRELDRAVVTGHLVTAKKRLTARIQTHTRNAQGVEVEYDVLHS
jgi:hypothetical protein